MSNLLAEHRDYLTDTRKLGLYQGAIAQTVKPGCHVIDLGCGSGILGLMCLRAGAGHVTFIDRTDMIEVARETIKRAGYADRATFFAEWSHHVTPESRADLVICDNVGYFGMDYGIMEAFADAAKRLLRPGGALVPRTLRLFAAPVEGDRIARPHAEWSSDDVPEDFRWVAEMAVNRRDAGELGAETLLAAGVEVASLELGAPAPAFLNFSAEARVERAGQVDGLAGWFIAELADGIHMTNAPACPHRIERPVAIFPFADPLCVREGDAVTFSILTRPSDSLWSWNVRNDRTAEKRQQSTWQGLAHAAAFNARRASEQHPRATARGRIRAAVLALCDGKHTPDEIEEIVLARCGDVLPSVDAVRTIIFETLADDTA